MDMAAASFCLSSSWPSSSSSFSRFSSHNRQHRLSASLSSIPTDHTALARIQNSGVIACLRAKSADRAIEAARAVLSAGISVLEVVMSTPDVFQVLEQLMWDYPTTTLGVGTVLHAEDAKKAIKFGAKFLMSPAIVSDILSDHQIGAEALYIPGAMTPTEILSAYNAGAKIVKVYPVSALGGIQYIAALRKPFSHVPLVASQGITIDMIGDYIAQGASSVVLSDAIFDKNALDQQNFDKIHQLARLAAIKGKGVALQNSCLWIIGSQLSHVKILLILDASRKPIIPDSKLPSQGCMRCSSMSAFCQMKVDERNTTKPVATLFILSSPHPQSIHRLMLDLP